MNAPTPLTDLTDRELLDSVRRLAGDERHATAALVAALAELDARRLYLGAGCSSLFTYCTQVLRLSEHAAYGRIEAARAARAFPIVLEMLADGRVTLTTVSLLRPHLTPGNHGALLDAAGFKSKREVEQMIAALRPQSDMPAIIRRLPTVRPVMAQPAPAGHPSTAIRFDASSGRKGLDDEGTGPVPARPVRAPGPAIVAPLAPSRYKIQMTVSRETHDKLRRAQDLLRHAVPDGDAAEIVDRALTLLVERLERDRCGRTRRPRAGRPPAPQSRRIPAAVRRAVWERDAGQCAFVGDEKRCTERGFLEFHHVVPYARGGAATPDNVELRCRAHNQHEARKDFGARAPVGRGRREPLPPSAAAHSVRTESRDPIERSAT